jgi:hypothetical protein
MSGLSSTADVVASVGDGREGPLPDSCSAVSFKYLVSAGKQRWWDLDCELFPGLEVHDRQVSGRSQEHCAFALEGTKVDRTTATAPVKPSTCRSFSLGLARDSICVPTKRKVIQHTFVNGGGLSELRRIFPPV